jgi:hypothetical protein
MRIAGFLAGGLVSQALGDVADCADGAGLLIMRHGAFSETT